jgi:hypothetical protein
MERITSHRISAASVWSERLFQPLHYAALVWGVMLTVLICALAPAGLPHTATQGSAFNPATTSVALHAKAPRERLLGKRVFEPASADPAAGKLVSHVAAVVPVGPVARRPAPEVTQLSPASGIPALAAFARAVPWARGPPLG